MKRFVLLLAGCGRIYFDPRSDPGGDGGTATCEQVGHDEDADGIDDACDVCPIIADGAQEDGDGDRVGDACDPNPAAPRDRIVFFDPFTSLRTEWQTDFSPTLTGDALRIPIDPVDGAQTLALASPDGEDVLAIGGRIVSAHPTDQRQLSLGFRRFDNLDAIKCAVNDGVPTGDAPDFLLSHRMGTMNFTDDVVITLTTPLATGAFRLRCRRTLTEYGGSIGWPPAEPNETRPHPGVPTTNLAVLAQGIEVELDYFMHVRSE